MLQVKLSGSGSALVWGHGLLGSMAKEEATSWFYRAGMPLRMVRYDACGHGRSERPLDAVRYRWPALAADMLAVARQHAGNRFALGGQSMGCASALIAALHAPTGVTKLVLATPPTFWSTRAAQVERYQQMIRLLRARGMPSFIQLSRQYPALPEWLQQARPEDALPQLESLGGFSRELLIAVIQGAIASDLPAPEQLHRLQQPALILAWRDDPIHPLSSAEQLASHLPNAELRVINKISELADWPQQIADFINS